jgi:hypothetical protein
MRTSSRFPTPNGAARAFFNKLLGGCVLGAYFPMRSTWRRMSLLRPGPTQRRTPRVGRKARAGRIVIGEQVPGRSLITAGITNVCAGRTVDVSGHDGTARAALYRVRPSDRGCVGHGSRANTTLKRAPVPRGIAKTPSRPAPALNPAAKRTLKPAPRVAPCGDAGIRYIDVRQWAALGRSIGDDPQVAVTIVVTGIEYLADNPDGNAASCIDNNCWHS